jgi:CDP-diacylglycerol---serine O-phosphatidyltransferase
MHLGLKIVFSLRVVSIKKHIPNIITLGNLFCGCLAVVFAFENQLVYSSYCVGIAALLDFFDGFAARLLNVGGEMGKQLDSLADMVSFGLVPAIVMYNLLSVSLELFLEHNPGVGPEYMNLNLIAFFIALFSALRLAKFNIDTRQSHSFIGVPTPANAMLICSFPLILKYQPMLFSFSLQNMILSPLFLILTTLTMSYLLIAELPLFAMKFKNWEWASNKTKYLFLLFALFALMVFHFVGIVIIVFSYIVVSVFNKFLNNTSSS